MSENAKPIDRQASEFAAKISRIAQIFGGAETADYQSDIVPGKAGWWVEIHNNQHGFTLSADEKDVFLVKALWTCSSDWTGQWLKVERSRFGVFLAERPGRPLFRYDFDADYSRRLPKAHIHFQADHPDMNPTQPMKDTQESLSHLGEGSKRARKRVRHKKQTKVSDLHFPVGGTRFRPALEDILLMMIEEYGVEPQAMDPFEAVKELRRSLEEWRISQAKAVIRDMPLLALALFESEGFQVVADPEAHGSTVDPHDYFKNRTDKLFDS
ncbi:hypothetical protein [Corynebacterium sp. p3-SID1194]|uniref:hypothetical protein n=1 Tax=Corynebacterium sp. p3-SID1194 TaxID=2916105 RepID=UPI0021A6C0B0|nr:hypothetical protein [Corynebacterium sp. p3-SID1194]MCT1449929.1 hypothetical protein [Corynebacterium sp. p3-SID1194]